MSKETSIPVVDEDGPAGAASSEPDAGVEAPEPSRPGPEHALPGDPEALAAELEGARRGAEELREELLRAHAEADNQRKRAARELENAHKYALERFIAELLPVKDSMELGLQSAGAEGADPEKVREGLELTLKMLCVALEKFGCAEVDPAGEAFDPQRHQAMTTAEAEGVDAGTVLTVYQKGYVLNDRLVRPAMVVVAK